MVARKAGMMADPLADQKVVHSVELMVDKMAGRTVARKVGPTVARKAGQMADQLAGRTVLH